MAGIDDIGNEAVLAELRDIAKIMSDIKTSLARPEDSSSNAGRGRSGSYAGPVGSQDPRTQGGSYTAAGFIGGLGQEMQSWANKRINGKTGQSTPPKLIERTGAFLEDAGANYMPGGARDAQFIGGVARRAGAYSSGLIASGQASGYNASGGDIGVGPFGMRTPFSDAGAVAIDQKIQAAGMALGAGTTYRGAQAYQRNLQQLGFKAPTGLVGGLMGAEDRSANNNYNKYMGALNVMGKNLGENVSADPQVTMMMTSATRAGTGSLKEFVDIMNQMPNVTRAASISNAQYLADLQSWAGYAQKGGATEMYGMKVGSQMEAATGLPAPVLQQGLQGGFVKANLMRQSGLMPWELGQATASQNINALYGTINQLDQQLGTPKGGPTYSKNARGFTEEHYASQAQDAQIAMLTGLPVSTIQKMRRDRKQVQASAIAGEDFGNLQSQIERIADKGGPGAAQRIKGLLQGGGRGTFHALTKEMKAAGFTKDEIDQVRLAGGTNDQSAEGLAKASAAAQAKFKDIESGKTAGLTDVQGGDQMQIELGPQAAELFKIIRGKPTSGKASQGRGGKAEDPATPYGFTPKS
jgi:hypothetical protein